MAIDFPASPTLNDVFTVGNVTYVWDGTKWTASVTGGISLDKIEEGNTSAEVIDTGSDGRFVVTTEGTERLRVTNTGRVGIGTASPNGNTNYGSLDLNGSAGGEIFFSSGGVSRGNIFNYSATPANLGIAATDASGQIIFNTGGYTERLRITSAGLVGIGTSTPVYKLDVSVATNDPTTGTPAAGSFVQVAGGTTTVGNGPSVLLKNASGAKETFWRMSAVTTSGNNGDLVFNGYNGGATYPERLRITAAGNVGIGTTSPQSKASFLTTSVPASNPTWSDSWVSVGPNVGSSTGAALGLGYDSSGDEAYLVSLAPGVAFKPLIIQANIIKFQAGSSGEDARIDSSGRLLVGTSSAPSDTGNGAYYSRLVSVGNLASSTGDGRLALCRGTTASSLSSGNGIGEIHFADSAGGGFAMISAFADGTPGANDYPGRLVFSTTADGASSPTERMRIHNGGTINMFVGTGSLNSRSSFAAGTSEYLYIGRHSATNVTNGTLSFAVYTNGNAVNTNGSYTAISDAKLKENIIDAGSQWDDFKAIQIRNWNFKAETGHETHRQIGPIAQELEAVCPGLVFETPDRDEDGNETGEVTKGVNQSVLYMKAVKALQEAMERIETLEGMVAVNNITIDEQQHQLSTLAARLTALESA
jgi:hypothetical protein